MMKLFYGYRSIVDTLIYHSKHLYFLPYGCLLSYSLLIEYILYTKTNLIGVDT